MYERVSERHEESRTNGNMHVTPAAAAQGRSEENAIVAARSTTASRSLYRNLAGTIVIYLAVGTAQ